MLIYSQYSSEKQYIQSDPVFVSIYEIELCQASPSCKRHTSILTVKLLWYKTGLAIISPQSIPQVMSVLKKRCLIL